jgi:UDP-N-acetylglucosamine--N-acetylmuramyl-(pentapeptide) pyrophosphoryl-undecaprenol N-acetylglucosamine transferase
MKKIIFTGGGSLGHFTPNIAIFNQLKDEYKCVYIGSNGIEKEKGSHLMPYYTIDAPKLIRSFTFKNFLIPIKLIKSINECKKILLKEKPNLIFSKGGYVSIPVVLAGSSLHIPILTHESDYTLGLANKIIAKKSKYVCTSFEETSKKLKNGIFTGSPIRDQIFNGDKNKVIKKFNLDTSKKTILVVGGSLGAENINLNIRKILPQLKEYNIIHLVGKGKINKEIKQNNYYQEEFTNNIEDYFDLASLVITRGGSNTLFELLSLKKTMLIIPLSSGRGDQILNAKSFYNNGYGNILFEENMNEITLKEKINETIKNAKIYENNMKKCENGTENIVKLIKSIIN